MEHRFHQLAATRQRPQNPGGRPGGVEEKTDPVGAPAPPKFPAQRDQVIVVNPEQVVRLDQRDQRVGETGVHPFIAPGKAALELRKIDTIVEQGPQREVGIAVVIFVYVLLFEIDGGGSDAVRSEEQTSEHQSLMRIWYAVFCLKKKNKNNNNTDKTRENTNKKE